MNWRLCCCTLCVDELCELVLFCAARSFGSAGKGGEWPSSCGPRMERQFISSTLNQKTCYTTVKGAGMIITIQNPNVAQRRPLSGCSNARSSRIPVPPAWSIFRITAYDDDDDGLAPCFDPSPLTFCDDLCEANLVFSRRKKELRKSVLLRATRPCGPIK